jgi:hypothetical protein
VTTTTTPPPPEMPVKQLTFDSRNPRLRSEDAEDRSQQDMFDLLWRDFAVDEVAQSIAANGYFSYEPMLVVREDGRLVVVEGNRRLAAVKALLGQMELSEGTIALPEITQPERDDLESVPVILTTRKDAWEYIGFKHVNGPQAWQSASKANYIAEVHNTLGIPLEEIARRIGDRHATVQRLYRALMVVDQAERADVFKRADRYKEHFSFSHLYTGLDYGGIQSFLKVKPTADESPDPVPEERLRELGDLCTWLYGSRSRNRPPLVTSQNPDLRILDDVLRSENGIAALRRGLTLQVSRDISKGDTQLLREALVSAKQSLQTARGRAITGYRASENDLVGLADDVSVLADALYEELVDLERQHRSGRRSRRHAPEPADT